MFANRPFYTRVALFGILIYLVAAIVTLVAIMVMEPTGAVFALFYLVPGLIVGAAVAFIRRWGLIVGLLGGLFGLLIFSGSAGLELSAPYAFFDFTRALFGLLGCAILLVASVLGLIESFRGQPKTTGAAWQLTALRGVTGVLVVLAAASAVATLLSMESVSAADKQDATVVIAKDVEWDIELIDAPAGQPLKIVVRNDDPILHTFTIHDLGIDVKLGPYTEKLVIIEPNRDGIFGFICRVVGHEEDMTGAIEFK